LWCSSFLNYARIWARFPHYPFLSLHFNGHIPGEPGLANARISPFWILLELRMIEVVVVTTGAIRPARSSQVVTTNKATHIFL